MHAAAAAEMLTVETGPMFSGKSTALLRHYERRHIAGHACLLIKHTSDEVRAAPAPSAAEHAAAEQWLAAAALALRGGERVCAVCRHLLAYRAPAVAAQLRAWAAAPPDSEEAAVAQRLRAAYVAEERAETDRAAPGAPCAVCMRLATQRDGAAVVRALCAALACHAAAAPRQGALYLHQQRGQAGEGAAAAPAALCVARLADVPAALLDAAAHVFVDEAQWFPDLVRAVLQWVHVRGRSVFVAGLDADFLQRPFANMAQLAVFAAHVHHHRAVCETCGSDRAACSVRRRPPPPAAAAAGAIQLVGGHDLYEARCHRCLDAACSPGTDDAQPAFVVIDAASAAPVAVRAVSAPL